MPTSTISSKGNTVDRIRANDVHRSFTQIAILGGGRVKEALRIELDLDAVVAFGQGLRKDDEVVLEATSNTDPIVRMLKPLLRGW